MDSFLAFLSIESCTWTESRHYSCPHKMELCVESEEIGHSHMTYMLEKFIRFLYGSFLYGVVLRIFSVVFTSISKKNSSVQVE